MNLDSKEQQTVREYLLGLTSREYSAWVEERLLADGEFYEELTIAEEELIDQYLEERLSQTERKSFENHFLAAPERQQKLHFARALQRYIVSRAGETTANERSEMVREQSRNLDAEQFEWNFFKSFLRRPALAFSLTVALLLVVVVAWIVISRRTERVHQATNVYAVVLTPGLIREGGETKKITLPPNVDTLRLQLEVPTDRYETFRAALLSEDRKEIWVGEALQPEASSHLIDFDVPARLLKPGDYQVGISGRLDRGQIEPLHGLSFRILKSK